MKALLPNSNAHESIIERSYFNSLERTLVAIVYYLLDKKGFTAKEAQDAAVYIFEFLDSMQVNDINLAEIKAELEKDYGVVIRRKGGHIAVGLKKEENNGKVETI